MKKTTDATEAHRERQHLGVRRLSIASIRITTVLGLIAVAGLLVFLVAFAVTAGNQDNVDRELPLGPP